MSAVKGGDVYKVDKLIRYRDVDVNMASDIDKNNTDYPLTVAVTNENKGIVQALLKHREIDVNVVGRKGHCPLTWAAKKGYEGIVEVLLQHPCINLETQDIKKNRTALQWATINGHENMAVSLCEVAYISAVVNFHSP